MKKALGALLFLLLLVPSAWYAWRNREIPQFGRTHDDAIHYIAAKSLADGQGYRILSLPGSPFETKYPPLLPLLLSLAWKIEPRFPVNLTAVTAIQWSLIPIFLWLTFVWLGRAGFSPVQRWAGVGLLAISPYTALFGGGITTEPLFAVFLLVSLLAIDKAKGRASDSWRFAAIAGFAAGLACLTRSAGVVALVSGPAVFLLWKMRREALAFTLGILPAVAGWNIWSKLHRMPAHDLISLYNTDYLAYYFVNMHWRDVGTVLWRNFGSTLYEMGGLVFPMEMGSFFWVLIRYTVAIAIITGLARRYKQRAMLPYMAFAVLTLAELMVWHATPNLRLMYPLAPLFLAGLLEEADHFGELLRQSASHKDRSQRVAGWLLGGVAAAFVLAALWMPAYMALYQLPAMISANEQVRADNQKAYNWIEKNVDPKANILLANPALYLYTGRHAGNIISLEIYWYREDMASEMAVFQNLPAYSAENGFDYVFLHQSDYAAMVFDHPDEARRTLEDNASMRTVFRSGQATLFQPSSSLSPAENDTRAAR